jgi:hypothetical protein
LTARAIRIAVSPCNELRLNANHLARGKPVAPVEDAALDVEHDRLQQPARFDIRRKLVEFVIGEHRNRMDGELAHHAYASAPRI